MNITAWAYASKFKQFKYLAKISLFFIFLSVSNCNISQYEGKDCKTEKKEMTDCIKYTNAYFMGLCNQDFNCMYEKGYSVTVYLNCQVLFEKIPSKCKKQPNSKILY